MAGESIFAEHVIAVDPGGELARRTFQAAIDRVALAGVRLARPETEPRRIPPYNFDGIIGAAAVENYIFDIGVSLQKNRPDSFLDKFALIE